MRLLFARAESGPRVHARPESAIAIGKNDTNFGGARVGIEDARHIADTALEHTVRQGVQANLGRIADVYIAEIIFVDVTDHPDVREIGDGKQVGRVVETLDAFES